ncbi:protein peste-like [Anopheles bellator]|uniref:protein peste-like n=1 Tax=Anopheles bellator TaxID=139047 RepID=UPI002647BD21|nr:protein peste-like [Anopheles bellator]
MLRCCRWYLVVGLGLGVAATGLIFFLAWRDIFDTLVNEEKALVPGTVFYKEWRRPTVRPLWSVYMFNWTNAPAYLSDPRASTATFEEVGPYTYEELSEMVDVKVFHGNGTIGYRRRIAFRRWPSTQATMAATPEPNITTVNFAAVGAAFAVRHLDYGAQRELSFLLHNLRQHLTVAGPADQLLFTGYHPDPLLARWRELFCRPPNASDAVLCQPERLAYFRTLNSTRKSSPLYYYLNVGIRDRRSYGEVNLEPCARGADDCAGSKAPSVGGFTGDLFPSRIDRTKPLALVLVDLCQRLSLVYDRETVVAGIVGYRFVSASGPGPSQPTWPPRNNGSGPFHYGMVNSYECTGLPLFGDPVRSDSTANRSAEIVLVLEPITGTVLKSSISVQFQTVLRPNAHIALFQDLPVVNVPLFRFTRHYQLPEGSTHRLKRLLHLLEVGHQAAISGCCLGVLLVALAVIYSLCKGRCNRQKQKPQAIPKSSSDYTIIGTQLSNNGTGGC